VQQSRRPEGLQKPQQYKFNALELDPRFLRGGPIMPRARLVKPPTHHIGFDFETGKRIQEQE
jgi:hypothetical protein